MSNFWVEHAKNIEELKKEPIFICFTQDILKKCNSKEDLIKEIKIFKEISPLEKLAKEYALLSIYNKKEEYGNLDMGLIGVQLAVGGSDDPVYKKFIGDSNDISGYFSKIISQESKDELSVYWAYINELKDRVK